MAIVMGPTPPGTGVIRDATLATLSKWTSPHSLPSVALVDSHVDDHGPGFDPIGGNLLGPAHRHDQDIGLPGDRRGVAGRGVANGHGRVAAFAFLKQRERHRLTHELRPAQDDGMWPPASRPRQWIKSSRTPSGVHGTNRGRPCREQTEIERM